MTSSKSVAPYVYGLVAVVSLVLLSQQGVFAITTAGHDDRLFLNQGLFLTQGQWLGPFSNLTLAKGPLFPVFLAINFYIGVPILVCQQIVHLLAITILVRSLKLVVDSQVVLVATFAVLALNPYVLSWMRITREPLYTAETILVVAAVIGLWSHLRAIQDPQEHFSLATTPWVYLLGVALASCWATREEGIWLVPLVLALFLQGLYVFLRPGTSARYLIGLRLTGLSGLVMPIVLSCAIAVVPILTLNAAVYGLWGFTDMKSAAFQDAYGSLTRVEGDRWHPYLPVPMDVREKIYGVSPHFAELKPYLEGDLLEIWSGPGCQLYPDVCGDIAGGWWLWALRDAVREAGYYSRYSASQAYFADLSRDINQACDQGALDCKPFRSSLAPRLNLYYLKQFPVHFIKGWQQFIALGTLQLAQLELNSIGSLEDIQLFESFLHNRANPGGTETPGLTPVSAGLITGIANFYRLGGIVLIPLSVLALVVLVLSPVPVTTSTLVAVVLFATVVFRMVLLSVIDMALFPGFDANYLMPGSPLLYIASILSLHNACTWMVHRCKAAAH